MAACRVLAVAPSANLLPKASPDELQQKYVRQCPPVRCPILWAGHVSKACTYAASKLAETEKLNKLTNEN